MKRIKEYKKLFKIEGAIDLKELKSDGFTFPIDQVVVDKLKK